MKAHPDQINGPDRHGRIKVAVRRWMQPTPRIPGYRPFWVNTDLDRDPVQIVTYKMCAR